MATDYYLQLDGTKGESTDSKHSAWIECTFINWSITQPRSATASTGGGHTAERAELSEISISKLVDLASPILAQICACGKTIPKAKLEMLRADGGGFPGESLGLKFSKIRWKYTQQKIGGGSNGNTAGGWDLSANRIA